MNRPSVRLHPALSISENATRTGDAGGGLLNATVTAFMVSSTGRSAWFSGVLVLGVYLIFASALYLLPPVGQ